ncbi:Hypothetical predicted protein [Pelobates cultripes]|uniref:Uncharacterized protein n=1 Tax=Pelobates cultripes TaxID=61616 RepID=A0AAD1SAG7_PELCU|nr:Hypothetical predicted protein [Pelobates cultripes]
MDSLPKALAAFHWVDPLIASQPTPLTPGSRGFNSDGSLHPLGTSSACKGVDVDTISGAQIAMAFISTWLTYRKYPHNGLEQDKLLDISDPLTQTIPMADDALNEETPVDAHLLRECVQHTMCLCDLTMERRKAALYTLD